MKFLCTLACSHTYSDVTDQRRCDLITLLTSCNKLWIVSLTIIAEIPKPSLKPYLHGPRFSSTPRRLSIIYSLKTKPNLLGPDESLNDPYRQGLMPHIEDYVRHAFFDPHQLTQSILTVFIICSFCSGPLRS